MKNRWFFAFEIAILCVTCLFFSVFYVLDKKVYPVFYREEIVTYATKYSVKPQIVISIIKAESGFRFDAKSSRGAIGLMQIMPQTAQFVCEKIGEEYLEEKLLQPEFNIMVGTYYFSYLNLKFKDLKTTLCAYNAGEGNVKKWLKNQNYSTDGKTLSAVPFKETETYTKKVLKNLVVYKIKF